MAKCPKCGTEVNHAVKRSTLAGRPDSDGERVVLEIGLFECPDCHKRFRDVVSKVRVDKTGSVFEEGKARPGSFFEGCRIFWNKWWNGSRVDIPKNDKRWITKELTKQSDAIRKAMRFTENMWHKHQRSTRVEIDLEGPWMKPYTVTVWLVVFEGYGGLEAAFPSTWHVTLHTSDKSIGKIVCEKWAIGTFPKGYDDAENYETEMM